MSAGPQKRQNSLFTFLRSGSSTAPSLSQRRTVRRCTPTARAAPEVVTLRVITTYVYNLVSRIATGDL